ncbi:hypothetical protein L1987_35753 [Smallanthus sonchifolius]|uniref:Uncharacterized protein n=1 Tax=Smallanthus sonchifolius TaxID=185202 RepID=A0ACB9HBI6_9ASTR|nr:hypothetical protein L1987_35753 [Smallanthus sonchifolius]
MVGLVPSFLHALQKMLKVRTPIGFDALLSSGGGGSYASRRDGSESSFSLSSDSDSESFMSINKLLISPVNNDALKVKETKEIQENESDINTQNAHLETEKTKLFELQKQVADLKVVISDSNIKIKSMGDELEASREKILAAEDEISDLKHELSIKTSKLGSTQQEMTLLKKHLDSEKECNRRLQEEDNLVRELETRLNSIQVEHVGVLSSFDNAQKVINELKLKVMEMEREVIRQREVLADRAEEKREVIRQLSFSLEHYMSGYKQLRQAFTGNNRHAVLTS